MGGRKLLVYVRIVVAAIFDFMRKMGRVKIATLRVSTWRFREQKNPHALGKASQKRGYNLFLCSFCAN